LFCYGADVGGQFSTPPNSTKVRTGAASACIERYRCSCVAARLAVSFSLPAFLIHELEASQPRSSICREGRCCFTAHRYDVCRCAPPAPATGRPIFAVALSLFLKYPWQHTSPEFAAASPRKSPLPGSLVSSYSHSLLQELANLIRSPSRRWGLRAPPN